ncbi:MAG: DUF445 family protein [Candidatus Palauibacterales bacterium]|nr:DUF445 family protein [Candidatus Palauibacterales bacterium]
MSSQTLIELAVTIGFGALAGGLTNAVAIWMLFHPHESRGLGRLRIQGAIPKNRARLAKTIGRTVGERLLTPQDLGAQLRSPGVQEAFDETVRRLVGDLLTTEWGSLRSELPEPLMAELEQLLLGLGDNVAGRVADFAGSERFPEQLADGISRAAATVADRPVSGVLTEARRAAIRERVEGWVAQAVASDDLEHAIRDWIDRQLVRAAGDYTPLLERLPAGMVPTVERAIASYLPVALERLGGVLRDPTARARIERTLHTLFDRFVQDLMLHERIVARLVVTERTISRMLDNLGREGTDQIGRLLDEPAMREEVAQNVNDAVLTFLRRPLAEHVQTIGSERLVGLRDTFVRTIVSALRDEATRGYAIERLDRALQSAEGRTWGELIERLPRDQAARWVADALKSPTARRFIGEIWGGAVGILLDKPIGRPERLLGEGTADRIADRLTPALWSWIERQVPVVVSRLDIPNMVEQKVLGFSLDRIEEIVRLTTQRELDIIVRLGFVLGGLVGLGAFGVGVLLRI